MTPNQRDRAKALVGAWVTQQLKDELLARAARKGLTQTDAVTQAIELWLQQPQPDSP